MIMDDRAASNYNPLASTGILYKPQKRTGYCGCSPLGTQPLDLIPVLVVIIIIGSEYLMRDFLPEAAAKPNV